jgi:hypothetical protein
MPKTVILSIIIFDFSSESLFKDDLSECVYGSFYEYVAGEKFRNGWILVVTIHVTVNLTTLSG